MQKIRTIRDIYWSELIVLDLFSDEKDDIGIPKSTTGKVDTDWRDGWVGVSFDKPLKDIYGNKMDWLAVPISAFEIID